MDARLQKAAMDQMSRMTPEQLAQIRNQMKDVSPEAMERMVRRMASMSPADVENIERKVKNTDPSTLPYVNSTIQTRQAHAYKASMGLKNEGNQLFKAGSYMAAVEKYKTAKSNMGMFIDRDSSELVMICSLNTANCYLKLEMYTQCIAECSEVLKDAPKNVKALYRRGQAYMHRQKYTEALTDLRAAHQLSSGDPTEQSLIQEKIDEVQRHMDTVATPVASTSQVEEISVEEVQREKSDQSGSWRPSVEAMAQMSDADIQAMNQMTGMDVTPEMIRSAGSAMKDMDSETLAQMTALAEKLNITEKGSQTSQEAPNFQLSSEKVHAMSEMFKNNPDLIKEQAKMMQSMSQDELDRLATLSGTTHGVNLTPQMVQKAAETISCMRDEELRNLPAMAQKTQSQDTPAASTITEQTPVETRAPPGDMALSPEMLKMASQMMEGMTPEDMVAMQSAVANGGAGAQSMPTDPNLMRHTLQMIHRMDEDDLVNMLGASGMCPENQARTVIRQMKQMSPGQMEMLTKAASYAQKGAVVAQSVKQWLRSRVALLCAILVIVIGVVLRYYGLM